MKHATRILEAFVAPSLLAIGLTAIALAVSAPCHAGDLPAKGTNDSGQTKALFDQIRDAIPKLKPGMTSAEARRVLMIEKLQFDYFFASGGGSGSGFTFPGNSSQSLHLYERDGGEFVAVELRNGDRIVASFNSDKK